MKLTFKDVTRKEDWLSRCVLSSMTEEAIESGKQQGNVLDVKLLVNGIELEPVLLGRLMSEIEKHIDQEAKILMNKRMGEPLSRVHRLDDLIEEACNKIRREFNIDKEDYEWQGN